MLTNRGGAETKGPRGENIRIKTLPTSIRSSRSFLFLISFGYNLSRGPQ